MSSNGSSVIPSMSSVLTQFEEEQLSHMDTEHFLYQEKEDSPRIGHIERKYFDNPKLQVGKIVQSTWLSEKEREHIIAHVHLHRRLKGKRKPTEAQRQKRKLEREKKKNQLQKRKEELRKRLAGAPKPPAVDLGPAKRPVLQQTESIRLFTRGGHVFAQRTVSGKFAGREGATIHTLRKFNTFWNSVES